jgi:hypothetical protein
LYHKTMNKKVNKTLIFHRSPQKEKLRVRAYFKFLNMFHGIKEIFATIVLEAFWNHWSILPSIDPVVKKITSKQLQLRKFDWFYHAQSHA